MNTEQLSLVIGENFVLSFTEGSFSAFNLIRERLRTGHSVHLLENGKDYLAYRLMDTTIDQYFVVLEKSAIRLNGLEENIIISPTQDNAGNLQLKHKILLLHKRFGPILAKKLATYYRRIINLSRHLPVFICAIFTIM